MKSQLPIHFQDAINKISRLKKFEAYSSAFIFGSAARGKVTTHSDLDIKIITSNSNVCSSVNHPFINGIKIDISFNPFEVIREETEKDIKSGHRIPMLAESIIIFDKTGELRKLKQKAKKAKPKLLSRKDHQWIKFMVYHATNKAERHLTTDPASALLAFHGNLGELLKFHYQINRRWWISNKRLLQDIREWDQKLGRILEKYLSTSIVKEKFYLWNQICQHILSPIGGPQEIVENNCHCSVCQKHLKALSALK